MTDEEIIEMWLAMKQQDFAMAAEHRRERIDVSHFADTAIAGGYDEPGYLPDASVRHVTWEDIRGVMEPGDEWWRYKARDSWGLVLMRGEIAIARIVQGVDCVLGPAI